MVDLRELLADLADESADLDARVSPLTPTEWEQPTPAPGWSIGHQIAHLAWTDHAALLAATDADGFTALAAQAAEDPTGFVDRGAARFLAPAPELLHHWRTGRLRLAMALTAVPAGTRLHWFGGARMSAASMLTARLMETWAHGQDVADALCVLRAPTARLRHIAHLGFRTLGHSFTTHGRPEPTAPVRIELVAPNGATWSYGPVEAENRLSGPALDFCLLVTRRRHHADLDLLATGPVAEEWLEVAQAFAGPSGPGRPPAAAAASTAG
ncbi:MAG TPA: TIGR03084 family metal-binding protein [Micromonosporaceae bacterium]|nr:TIGR03084 family metal-binding protein [Micromonosporaceae bacterium]